MIYQVEDYAELENKYSCIQIQTAVTTGEACDYSTWILLFKDYWKQTKKIENVVFQVTMVEFMKYKLVYASMYYSKYAFHVHIIQNIYTYDAHL